MVNLVKLYGEGRAKSPTEPWSEEELNALYVERVPADAVRKGILTKEDFQKSQKAGNRRETETSADAEPRLGRKSARKSK